MGEHAAGQTGGQDNREASLPCAHFFAFFSLVNRTRSAYEQMETKSPSPERGSKHFKPIAPEHAPLVSMVEQESVRIFRKQRKRRAAEAMGELENQQPAQRARLQEESKKEEEEERQVVPLFSTKQVKRIVVEAVALREAQIRKEYDATLLRLLQEQFESFTKFNQDYIGRSQNRSTASYIM